VAFKIADRVEMRVREQISTLVTAGSGVGCMCEGTGGRLFVHLSTQTIINTKLRIDCMRGGQGERLFVNRAHTHTHAKHTNSSIDIQELEHSYTDTPMIRHRQALPDTPRTDTDNTDHPYRRSPDTNKHTNPYRQSPARRPCPCCVWPPPPECKPCSSRERGRTWLIRVI
jgi:hypothetical protein